MENLLIGRKLQRQELEEALASKRPEMPALVGRRRVGKTYLVRQIYAGRINFELSGLQNGGKADQVQNYIFSMQSIVVK